MTGPILLPVCILLIGLAVRMFQSGLRTAETDRVLERLADGQPLPAQDSGTWTGLERMFLRAGLGRPTDRLGLWLTCWVLGVLLGYFVAGWPGLIGMIILPALLLRLYIAWRYQRRLNRMIQQLPHLPDHTVRSLKTGRTLPAAGLGGIPASEGPLKRALGSI